MTCISTVRSRRPSLRHGLGMLAAAAVIAGAAPAAAQLPTQSWNGYKWARTGPLAIQLGNNLNASWSSLLAPSAAAWSAAQNIDFVLATGRSTNGCAGGVYGTVQVCNGNYGANGWLGYANVWLSRGYIVQATVRLNDHYFSQPYYNTPAWRQQVMCQEVGHTLGLGHTNTNMTNLNTGSCMYYTNNPAGLAGSSNGTLANLWPNSVDFAALNGIYATVNTTQLASTTPTLLAGASFGIDGEHEHSLISLVPEPGSWLLLITGFGGIGAALRRQRRPMTA